MEDQLARADDWSLKEALILCEPSDGKSKTSRRKNKEKLDKGPSKSFGNKTVGNFAQECNICDILDIRVFAEQEGFTDRDHLTDLIEGLKKDKRPEFSLGTGRKACKLLVWERSASRVPLRNISLFQLACTMKESTLVEKYLEQGVDVNRPIEATYNGEFAGRSPLHLALSHLPSLSDYRQRLLTTDLLLCYGANVHAKDSQGNTPLHTLFSEGPFNRGLFEVVMKHGADDNAVNNLGETPFELLIASNASLDIENYIKLGGRINRFNSVNQRGCITAIIRRVSAEKIGNALSLMEIDKQGRSAIHNIVSCPRAETKDAASNELYYEDVQTIIEYVTRQGGNIDCRDNFGKTPLHYAASFRNGRNVSLLLRLGADMNVNDLRGASAFAASLNLRTTIPDKSARNDDVLDVFMLHLQKLRLVDSRRRSTASTDDLDEASRVRARNIRAREDFGKSKLYDLASETTPPSPCPAALRWEALPGSAGLLVTRREIAQRRSALFEE